jgi:hypothetical protein
MEFHKVIKHFDGIWFWKASVIRMTAMIKTRSSTTVAVASRSERRYRGAGGSLDASGGQAAGRRATSGHGVASAKGMPCSEPQPWPNANAGGSRVASAVQRAFRNSLYLSLVGTCGLVLLPVVERPAGHISSRGIGTFNVDSTSDGLSFRLVRSYCIVGPA